jgi:hypothetical protein
MIGLNASNVALVSEISLLISFVVMADFKHGGTQRRHIDSIIQRYLDLAGCDHGCSNFSRMFRQIVCDHYRD